ncbi:MAG: hypothetical protein RL113_1447 [Pseudomonadota bacterium]
MMKMTCLICDNRVENFVDEKSQIRYYYCKNCHTILKDPQNYQDFMQQKARYDLHDNDEDHSGYQAYFQRFLDFVLPLVGVPTSALDFGCGKSTLLALMLENAGIPCAYYDPIYHQDTIQKNQKYDLIVSTEVFEHLHDPKAVFEDLLYRLEEGGYLAIQTQFHPDEIEPFKRWYYHQDPTHIVFFTPTTFQVLCQMHGMKYVGDNGKNIVVLCKGN